MSSGVPEFDTVSDNGLLSRNEPIRSKVSKLTEKLRKRVPTNTTGHCGSHSTSYFSIIFIISTFKTIFYFCPSTGNCYQCNSAFSVLKKRVWPLIFIMFNMLFNLYNDSFTHDYLIFSRETAVTVVSAFVPAVARIKCSNPVWEPQV